MTKTTDTRSRRSKLSAAKQALLAKLMQGGEESAQQAISKRPHEGHAELSFGQQRLWYLDQLDPESTIYNLVHPYRLSGRLDEAALVQSLTYLQERHESLRTVFEKDGDDVKQTILPPSAADVTVVDLTAMAAQEREQEVERRITAQSRLAFDLEQGPLFRTVLLRVSADEHILLLNLHHIITDGWSTGILLQELTQCYDACQAGNVPSLTPLPVQYADYAHFQRHEMTDTLEQQLAYWKKQLGENSPILQLPTDRQRPAVQTYRGRAYRHALSERLSLAVQNLARQEEATLFMTLLSAFNVLLYRYTHQDDIRVGTIVAGRSRDEIEGLIGFFVNTLVLRGDLSGQPGFREVLRRMRDVTLEAFSNQDVPFEKLVEELKPERDLSYSPLFQTMFVLQNMDGTQLTMEGLTVTGLDYELDTSRYDLTLYAYEEAGVIKLLFEYNTDLFEEASIARLGEHFANLLEGITARPDAAIEDLPLLGATDTEQLLYGFNNTATRYTDLSLPLHELFERQAVRTPDAPAVRFEEKVLTYKELNTRANQLARRLQRVGVRPDDKVGVCMERSLEMVIALYGILKAGGAYVPLDPTYPEDRLVYLFSDSQADVLLTQAHLLEQLPEHGAHVLCLDRDWAEIAQESGEKPTSGVNSDHLAYMIYTSGSTGNPKGTMVPHKGIVNRLLWMQEAYGLTAGDNVLQKTPFSFDVSVWEFFWPLFTGACLVVAKPEGHKDSEYLCQLIQERQITTLHFVPSMLQVFLEEKGIEQCTSLKRVICSGEALPYDLQQRFFDRIQGVQLHNLYGPTEASVDVTYWACDPHSDRKSVPIGRPIANIQLYVLDRKMQPVPHLVAGELHIGGIGLARGYHNRPELTDERFVPNPFGEGKLYKTGDLARIMPDGVIEYLGRLDHQVKLRGFRIELGEIEAALTEHPQVRETVVVAREDVPGNPRLVAYAVAEEGTAPTEEELRQTLKEKLPEYMVPTAILLLEALPLTPNGKVDRKALPKPELNRDEAAAYVAPRNASEAQVAAIWSELLGVEQVGAHDNFFSLGGHSLLAIKALTRLRAAFDCDLPLRVIFEEPTPAAMAKRAAAESGHIDSPITTVERSGAMPLSYAQQRMWFLHQLSPEQAAYNMVQSLRFHGLLNVQAVERSLSEIAKRHEILRSTFPEQDGQPVQIIHDEQPLAFTVHQDGGSGEERLALAQKRVEQELAHPFDLEHGPLFRASLTQLAEDDHVLLINMHHILSDGWSWGVFQKEFTALYTAFSADEQPSLPELPIQYADYAHWQRNWLQEESCREQSSYWKEKLSGTLPLLELPVDFPRSDKQDTKGAYCVLDLPETLTHSLKKLGREEGATLFMTLLAAFKTLLGRLSGQDDVILGSPIVNRSRREVEDLIGVFLNTLVLRTDLSGSPTFRDVLHRVRETALGAYAHQDVPFEKLIEEIQPERNLSRNALFEVLVNYGNFDHANADAWALPGIQAEFFGEGELSAAFPMTLYINEEGDGLSLVLLYQQQLFTEARIRNLLGQFQALLEQVALVPDQPLHAFSLFTPLEQTLLPDPSQALAEPEHPFITERLAHFAQTQPEWPAVSHGGHTVSYGELAAGAELLARQLLASGLQKGDVTAITGPRSAGFITAMLAVLNAGGVMLTIDPSLPAARRRLMLEHADAKLLLHIGSDPLEAEIRDLFPADNLLHVDAQTGRSDRSVTTEHEQLQLPTLDGNDAAYLFFTSGTTGVPKGVLGQHRGLNHFLHWQRTQFAVEPKDRSAQLINLSFDVVLRDIFLPLTGGATLCLPDNVDALDGETILPWLMRERITIVHTVPSLAQSWLQAVPEGIELNGLRLLFFAGEPLTDTLVNRWRGRFQGTGDIINLYGPTETTLAKCFYIVPQDNVLGGVQPVGQPLPDTQVLILSEQGERCAIGETGEIVIRTPFCTRGYVNAPDEQAKRFLPSPFTNRDDDLLYRTGDRGRYRPDGLVEILGRTDDQVKIRGVRIELNEVTAAILRHESVDACAVIDVKDEQGQAFLAAYVVPAAADALNKNELRTFLAGRLMAAAVPSSIHFMERLPVTPNGKIDRRALPAPERQSADRPYTAPRDAEETAICQIWQDALDLERVGIDDNFFDIGGHSLVAIRVVSQIRNLLHTELSLRDVFLCPTVAELAARVREQGLSGQQAPKIQKLERSAEPAQPDVAALSDDEVAAMLAKLLAGEE